MACYRIERGAIVVSVRLTPRGGQDAVEGVAALADGREVLLARVRAVPEKGAANTALVALLADIFHRPKAQVRIVAGASGRLKQVEITGDSATLSAVAAGFPRR